jgi:activating signal cointegrator complex subunit 1
MADIAKGIQEVPQESYGRDYKYTIKDSCCYRTYCAPVPEVFKRSTAEEEELYNDVDEESDDESQRCVRDPETGQYALPLPSIGPQYYKFIIGSKGAVRESIENETGATIHVPRPNDPEGCLVVRGITKASCITAQQRIDIIVAKSSKLIDYTHLISIPLSHLQKEVSDLLTSIDKQCTGHSKGVHPSIFQSPQQLHLTILMLRLYQSDELSKARHLMNQGQVFIDDVFRSTDQILIKGLNYMNDDPSEVHILYLQVGKNNTCEKLSKLIEHISQLFISAGLATENEVQHNEKLHATLMNSKWRKSDEKPTTPSEPIVTTITFTAAPRGHDERVPFDIRHIMKQFGDVDLGCHPLKTIELSRMGTKDNRGYWMSDHSVPFPSA